MRALIKKTAFLALVLFASAPALADDEFARGQKLYDAKNYSQAEPVLIEVTTKLPQYWPGHYYLANTLLALGKRSDARKEYESCLSCQPPPSAEAIAACQKVIVSLGGSPPESPSASASAIPLGDVKPAGADGDDKKAEAEPLRDRERRWHIERLMKMCQEKIEALKEERKVAMENTLSQRGMWARAEDGNTRKWVLSDEIEAAVNKEYDEKVARVQEETEREIAGIH